MRTLLPLLLLLPALPARAADEPAREDRKSVV